MQPVRLFVDDDMDAHRLFQFHAVIVDEPLRLEAAVRPFRNCRFELCFRHLQQAAEAREGLFPSEFYDQFVEALLAQPIGAKLPADVAEHEFGRAIG